MRREDTEMGPVRQADPRAERPSICIEPVLGSGKTRTRFRPHSPAL